MNGLIKIFGGKHYLKHWIIENFPSQYKDMEYFEPFCGAGNIILNKKISTISETISDINQNLINLWRTVRSYPDIIIKELNNIQYTEKSFVFWKNFEPRDYIPNDFCQFWMSSAIKEYVISRMSRIGLQKDFAWSDRKRGNQPGDVNAWSNSIKNLPIISNRIKNIDIKCESAIDSLSRTLNNINSLIYLDPPYLYSTRTTKNAYKYEMSEEDHNNFLDLVLIHKGKVLISGYMSDLYKNKLNGWNISTKSIVNHASQTKVKKIKEEVIWKNY